VGGSEREGAEAGTPSLPNGRGDRNERAAALGRCAPPTGARRRPAPAGNPGMARAALEGVKGREDGAAGATRRLDPNRTGVAAWGWTPAGPCERRD
jgi:hypothetical protein